MNDHTENPRLGAASAIGAFAIWGVLPLYWTQIAFVPALEIIGHRVLWGAVLAWGITLYRRRRSRTAAAVTTLNAGGGHPLLLRGRPAVLLLINGALVTVNWLVYVWAVSSGRTLDASLGYYINPLVSVFLGMIFLKERLTALQWVALALAVSGVLVLTFHAGVFPWVSLTLAFTFGFYGLIKKQTSLPSIHGLAVELLPVVGPALLYLLFLSFSGTGYFGRGGVTTSIYLLGAGVATVAPLLLFGIAARNIRLADVGFLQYIAPTGMFLIALLVFREPVGQGRLAGFILVWVALGLYTGQNIWRRIVSRNRRKLEGHRGQ